MSDKIRLHDLRLKQGLGLEMTTHEAQELTHLQTKEHTERQASIEQDESEFAAIGWR
jgi:hypothetical protein